MRFVGAALAAAITCSFASFATSKSCANVPTGELSLTCNGACGTNEPCLAGAMATSACRCIDIDKATPNDFSKFTLFVPFGKYKSPQELAGQPTPSEVVKGNNATTTYPWVSNDDLTKITSLNLSSATKAVYIYGGSSFTGLTRNHVANIEFGGKFLTAQTQVTTLVLRNLNLGSSVNALAAFFPAYVNFLDLTNGLITEFPANIVINPRYRTLCLSYNYIQNVNMSHKMDDLTSLLLNVNKITSFTAVFPKLTYLDLAFNVLYGVPDVIPAHTFLTTLHLGGNTIITFNQSHVVDTIKTLTLFDNNLETFDAYFPNLVSLDLKDNNLKSIPPKIFQTMTLKKLYLEYNKLLLNLSLTNEQANFIYNLDNFSIDTRSLQTDCAAAQKFNFSSFGYSICITEPVNTTLITGPRVTPTLAVPSSSGSSSASSSGSGKITAPEPESNSSTGIIVGCIAGVVALILVVGCFFWSRKHSVKHSKHNTKTESTSGTGVIQSIGTNYISLWNDPDLLAVKVSADDVQDVRKIGIGAYSEVWLVRFRGARLLASKRLRESEITRQRTQDFIEEIKLVAVLKHPSIVQLVGATWIRETDLQALFEYMDNSDLRDYLADPTLAHQWSTEKVQIAIDIAEALVYLHSFSPPLVHRDLKSRNVLLSSEMQAKLTDFGVSRWQSEQLTMTAGVGTGRWLAPEVIVGAKDYGPSADIFSFGAVLAELDSHAIPYDGIRSSNGNKLADVAILQLVSTGELKPSLTPTCPAPIAELAMRCFALDPADRPNGLEVAYILRTYKKTMTSFYV